MPKQKKTFHLGGLGKLLASPFRINFSFWIIGGYAGLMGLLLYSGLVDNDVEEEIQDGATVTHQGIDFTLISEREVLTTVGNHDYILDFESELLIIREAGTDDVIERYRFEEAHDSTGRVSYALEGGILAAEKLQTAFENAENRWLVGDEILRDERVELAREFLENYGSSQPHTPDIP